MKKFYITFSGARYDETTEKILTQAPKFGADEVLVYDDLWLTQHEFYKLNQWIFDHPGMTEPNGHRVKRGMGWYSWKPLVILETFSRMAPGDIVLFSDADTYPIADLSIIYDIANRDGAMLFSACWHKNRGYCKRDCYIVLAQDDPKYYDVQAGVARFMAFKKGPWKPYQFLMEWITYCVNPLATTFDASVLSPELVGFEEHRTEQAIMTLLAHKYGYKLYREACDAGEPHPADRDLYGQLFQQQNQTKMGAPAEGSRWRNV